MITSITLAIAMAVSNIYQDNTRNEQEKIVESNKIQALTYSGDSGIGKGKHIVFIANDHEYKSEESMPELAKILAKNHGFKCTVLFGIDRKTGEIVRGDSNYIPGTESLDSADLLVIFARFQNLPKDQMEPIVNYLKRGGPVLGLRTSTHAFKIPKGNDFEKFSYDYNGKDFEGGFGRQILGETWAGHNGSNHTESVRMLKNEPLSNHPILIGVNDVWSELSSYVANPSADSKILLTAIPLTSMDKKSNQSAKNKPMPGAWIREYKLADGKVGKAFATTHGGPGDLLNDGFRRLLVNACLWCLGMEKDITPKINTDIVGPYRPTWTGPNANSAALHIQPKDLSAWDSELLPSAIGEK